MRNVLQILCRALGGRTGRSAKGWDIGVSCMHPTTAAARLFAPLKLPVHMPIIEFHQDEVRTVTLLVHYTSSGSDDEGFKSANKATMNCVMQVWDLPPHAEVLARSDKTGVEMFRLGDRAMGVQGHPEYSKDILMSIADRLLQHNLILVSPLLHF